ncbi:hypothetical protein [Paenibacillus nasutitermitis]|uniref:hypothetical protein n=1 Tax=Paenibacillus nasutitermitis TaxID=1652958 RepID=UPI001E2F6430|nr:hypothetical protein [Paenibacillus nasutitermitis]
METGPKNSMELLVRVSVEVWLLISRAKMDGKMDALLMAEIEKVDEAYFWLQPRMEEVDYVAKRD